MNDDGIDYRELLIRYMALVGMAEGIYYLNHHLADGFFSKEELDLLTRLARESDEVEPSEEFSV